jgi:hypothetical protein
LEHLGTTLTIHTLALVEVVLTALLLADGNFFTIALRTVHTSALVEVVLTTLFLADGNIFTIAPRFTADGFRELPTVFRLSYTMLACQAGGSQGVAA